MTWRPLTKPHPQVSVGLDLLTLSTQANVFYSQLEPLNPSECVIGR